MFILISYVSVFVQSNDHTSLSTALVLVVLERGNICYPLLLLLLLELSPTWPAVTPPTLHELCRAWPAVTPKPNLRRLVHPTTNAPHVCTAIERRRCKCVCTRRVKSGRNLKV